MEKGELQRVLRIRGRAELGRPGYGQVRKERGELEKEELG